MNNEKETQEPPVVKTLDMKENKFTANGQEYFISEKISVRRFREYEKLVPQLTFGIGFNEMYAALGKSYKALNEKRFADAAIITHNIMSGIKDADDEKRFHPALHMCALVINRKGEDTGKYDKALMEQKISDWEEEGLNMLDFFTLALTSINGFKETYILHIQKQAQELVEKSDLMKKVSS